LRISDVTDSGDFVRLMELIPPSLPSPNHMSEKHTVDLSLRFDRMLQSINSLEALADGFCLPELKDSERIHLNSVCLAAELRRRTGSAIVPTLTLRDSNRQNILGTIAYAMFAGVENLLIVRGDPYQQSSGASPKNVYDIKRLDSIVSSIRKLESHLSNAKNRMTILSPINLSKIDDKKYLDTIKSRELAGVDLFLAESLFEDVKDHLEKVKNVRKAGVTLPIVHTIFPLQSYEDALNCVSKFGWNVSPTELEGLRQGGPEYGLAKARERYRDLLKHRDLAEGACISTRGDPERARLIAT